ncbi:hypothetical protein HpMS107_57400 [Helicobacter pylori]
MKQRRRIYYSETQKALMWERWRKGDTLHQIARLFDRYHSSVQRILAESGGIQPAPRHRSRLALTLAEREEISRSVVAGLSIRSIAFRLGRAPSAPPLTPASVFILMVSAICLFPSHPKQGSHVPYQSLY